MFCSNPGTRASKKKARCGCGSSDAACCPCCCRKRAHAAAQELLEEAHLLGREYGTEMSERGVTLKDTIEAFVFFRTMVLDSTNPSSWSRIIEAADRVLVGMADSYEDSEISTPAKSK